MDREAEKRYLELVDSVNATGRYKPDWDSLSQVRVPAWFDQERLGIFLHWGLYSVPAYDSEWYSRNMYIQGSKAFLHHVSTYGPQKEFGYKDFIPLFTAPLFDAGEWAALFKEAGAGYIVPVAEHHDGFPMYESELSDYHAAGMGPKRDILGELKAAAEKEGLWFGTSSHRAEHWWFMSHGKEFDSDIREPLHKGDFYWPAMPEGDFEDKFSVPYPNEEYLDDWLARTAELVYRYQPSLLYFDWWIGHEAFKPYLLRFLAFYYNCGHKWGKDVIVCYKQDALAFGTGIVEVERGGFSEAKPYRWQTDTAVARNSWCHTDALDYKSGEEVIINLVDAVSKNGNLLLNVGPKADGSFADQDRKILQEVGAWLRVNGEAIRGARPWRKALEGPTNIEEGQFSDGKETVYTKEDYRFTSAHGRIYAICLKCPEDGQFLIGSMKTGVSQSKPEFQGILSRVDILGYEGKVDWRADKEGLHVHAPGIQSQYPVTLRIWVK